MNIVAIGGNSGVGKTTLANMIKHIQKEIKSTYLENKTYEWYCNNYFITDWSAINSISKNLQILSFADPLKQQVIALTGCTLQDLDNQEFKKSLSKLSIEEYSNEKHIHFEPYRPLSDFVQVNVNKKTLTYRELMLYLSDDTKESFGKDVYAKILFEKWDRSKHLLITDLRYAEDTRENEEGYVRANEGIIVKLTRPGLQVGRHSSETSISKIKANIEHENIELEDLWKLAKEIVTYL